MLSREWRAAGNLMRLCLEALECQRDGRKWGFVLEPESKFLSHLVLWGFDSALIPKEAILKVEMREGRWKRGREGRKRGRENENMKRSAYELCWVRQGP